MAMAVAEAVWVSLAGAIRVTCRSGATLKTWKSAGLFSDDEWRIDESQKQGPAHPVFIRLDALERVHRAKGGIYWHPDQADEVNPPPRIAKRYAAMEEEIERLRAKIARLERQAVPTTPLSLAELLPTSPARHVSRTGPTGHMKRSDDLEDFLPMRDGDRAQSVNAFADRHGFGRKSTNTWRKPMQDGKLPWIIDGEKQPEYGGPWERGYVKVRYIIFAEGRRAFCERFKKLDYAHSCGDPNCECYGILRPA